jgi:hypothetical protein
MLRTVLAGMIALGATSGLYGQLVVSIKAGMVHYAEGKVLLDGKQVDPRAGNFPEMNPDQVLRTERGRVEVLLGPRLSEDSEIRMVNNDLADTRLEFIGGSALFEVADLQKDASLKIKFNNNVVSPTRNGIYRLDSEPSPQLKVYEGRADVLADDKTIDVRKGRLLLLDSTLQMAKFDTNVGDTLHRWSNRRASYLSMANVSAASSLRERGLSGFGSSGWFFNPYFGMFTFIPMSGMVTSPFGFNYFSPVTVTQIFYRPVYRGPSMSAGGGTGYNPNLGYSTSAGRVYGGYGSSAPSSPGGSAPAAASAPAASPRSAPAAAPRSGAGGGRGQ